MYFIFILKNLKIKIFKNKTDLKIGLREIKTYFRFFMFNNFGSLNKKIMKKL